MNCEVWWVCNLHSFSFSSPFLTIAICISLHSRIFAESARCWGLVQDVAVWIYYCRDGAETGRDDAELSVPRWRQFTKEVDCQIFKNKDGRLNFMNKTVPDHLNTNYCQFNRSKDGVPRTVMEAMCNLGIVPSCWTYIADVMCLCVYILLYCVSLILLWCTCSNLYIYNCHT